MAIEIVDLPIKNGGSFHSYVNVYQRVRHLNMHLDSWTLGLLDLDSYLTVHRIFGDSGFHCDLFNPKIWGYKIPEAMAGDIPRYASQLSRIYTGNNVYMFSYHGVLIS